MDSGLNLKYVKTSLDSPGTAIAVLGPGHMNPGQLLNPESETAITAHAQN